MGSPVELFLARLGHESLSYQEMYERIQTLDRDEWSRWMDKASKVVDITWSGLSDLPVDLGLFPAFPTPSLMPPEEFKPSESALWIYSYSSLVKSMPHDKKTTEFKPPHDWNASIKNPHTLPSGSDMGSLLHKVLELVPLGALDKKEIKKIVANEMRGSEGASWQDIVEHMITQALTCPLPLLDKPFSLTDIDPKRVYRETEFLFPWHHNLKIEGFDPSEGFLKGVIDLMFQHNGKYYILDWKSNWLGPSSEFYSKEYLEQAMHQHRYFIQAKVYREALKNYLKNVDSQPFEAIFGGAIYFFLRGVNPLNRGSDEDRTVSGIYLI